ncbi:MAG: hypothetical protein ACLVKS_02210 [Peptococcus niger]|nr:hypothetical protein [Peptococcus niger]
MLGLRTQESDEFMRFFKLVQKEAGKLNAVFFADFGQCGDLIFEDMELDRLFGWLIPEERADDFNKEFVSSKVNEKWDVFCMWVIPEIIDGQLKIKFE